MECLENMGVSYFTSLRFLNVLLAPLLITNTSRFLVPGSGLYPATSAVSTLASSV